MGLQGLPRKPIQFPFAGGLSQKGDVRQTNPPSLDICKDAEFDTIGALRTRKPSSTFATAVIGGGLITDSGPIRTVVDNNGELVALTTDGLYSWIAEANAWTRRDTHLAATVKEFDVFNQNSDQSSCDRAELNGTIILTWNTGATIWAAAIDKATGAVLLAPTAVAFGGIGSSPRLVALSSRILLFAMSTVGPNATVEVLAIDPASVAASVAGIPASVTTSVGLYDVVAIPGSDAALLVVTLSGAASYKVAQITAALVITSATKARPCNGTIAIAVDPNGVTGFARIARVIADNVTVQADQINTNTLTDVAGRISQVLGTASATGVSNLTATFVPGTAGTFTLVAFWSYDESISTNTWVSMMATVDGFGTVVAGSNFVRLLGIASRAFTFGVHAYVWGVFASATGVGALGGNAQLQNTNLLYRDDGMLVGKCVTNRGGGYNTATVLPGVQPIGATGFAWCATARRIVPTAAPPGASTASTYSGRVPCGVVFAFDDQAARRSARIGKTRYFAGAQVEQYDGTSIAEVGWSIYPWRESIVPLTVGGALSAGAYAVKATVKSTNAAGEIDRSTTATVEEPTTTTATAVLSSLFTPVFFTRRTASSALPTIEVWRTQVNPGAEAPFFLVSNQNPLVTANPNRYVVNDPTIAQTAVFTDALADTAIALLQANPENGSTLPSFAPPPATVLAASDVRLFLGGIAGQPNTIAYSLQRNDGFVVGFNPALTLSVPIAGGDITAITPFNGALLVSRGTALYQFAGDGFDNTLGGSNYQLSRTLSTDLGIVSQEAMALCDEGLYFKTSKGWYLLDLGWNLVYIGSAVVNYDGETVVAAHALTGQHQLRVLTTNRLLIYDTLVKQWGEDTIANGASATLWNGTYVYTDGANVFQQRADFVGINYGMQVETPWIKLDDLQSRGSVFTVQVLGEFRGPCGIRIQCARDYQYDGAGNPVFYDDDTKIVTPTVVGSALQIKHGPSQKRCAAIKVRITAVANDGTNNPPTTEAFMLTGLALDVGLEPGLYRGFPTAQEV